MKLRTCLVTSPDSYSDKMLESADTLLSMSVPIQSLDNNLSAADCLAPLSNALSTHTTIADYNDLFSNCNYYSVQELNNKLSNGKDSELFLIHVNIRSIQKNIDNLTNFLSELKQKPGFILLTETKLIKKRDIIVDISIPGYIFVHEDTTTSAGGVAMYIKININYSIDFNIKFEISGSKSLCINIENDIVGKLTVGVIYCHPVYDKDSIGKFIESIENVHRKIISQKQYFFVMGDINIDLLKIEKNENSRNYANSSISSSCKCQINIPKRVNINSATLVDHAYTSLLKNILLSGVLVTDISDYYPILFSLISNAGKNYKTEKHVMVRDFTAFSKDKFNKTLQEALNENVVSTMYISEQTKIFLNTFSNTENKLAPFRKMTQKVKTLKRKP